MDVRLIDVDQQVLVALGAGQNTEGGTVPIRLAAQYQAIFTDGTP